MDVRVGLWRRLSAEELMLLNCGVGEDSWESLGLQGDPTNHSDDQPWDFFGGNDAEAETPVLWPPHAKSWLIGKDPDAERDWGQEEKGTTEDEMAGWHHWLDGHESGWTLGVGDGQGGLACCNSWGRKELDTTEQLNWTELTLATPISISLSFVFSLQSVPRSPTSLNHPNPMMGPPPVLLPGKSHGQRSMAGYSSWGCKRGGHNLAAKQIPCIHFSP